MATGTLDEDSWQRAFAVNDCLRTEAYSLRDGRNQMRHWRPWSFWSVKAINTQRRDRAGPQPQQQSSGAMLTRSLGSDPIYLMISIDGA
jgi:hypothetical protein